MRKITRSTHSFSYSMIFRVGELRYATELSLGSQINQKRYEKLLEFIKSFEIDSSTENQLKNHFFSKNHAKKIQSLICLRRNPITLIRYYVSLPGSCNHASYPLHRCLCINTKLKQQSFSDGLTKIQLQKSKCKIKLQMQLQGESFYNLRSKSGQKEMLQLLCQGKLICQRSNFFNNNFEIFAFFSSFLEQIGETEVNLYGKYKQVSYFKFEGLTIQVCFVQPLLQSLNISFMNVKIFLAILCLAFISADAAFMRYHHRGRHAYDFYDENQKMSRCDNDLECDGERWCSAWGWCQGTARPPKNADYRYDEEQTGIRCPTQASNPNYGTKDYYCDGNRTCSQWGWCQGTAR